MKIAVSVHGDPEKTASPATALAFTRAALTAGHQVPRVFFYHDGVRTGCDLDGHPTARTTLLQGWVDLKRSFGTDLLICIAAAEARGLYNIEQARTAGKTANLHPAFQVVGLGQFTEMIMTADRALTFDG